MCGFCVYYVIYVYIMDQGLGDHAPPAHYHEAAGILLAGEQM
jgi:hypothetical protein